jgi:GntR family transcriptional regulator, transcriptional repressor for pyruvate dehydrogenase complex
MQIRALIENGRLKQGDRLPPESELSGTFKVSRSTVREALRTLESLKLVQSRQGEGTYVLKSNEEAFVQPLAAALFHDLEDLHEIFLIRKIFEPHIAGLAAENATPEEIEEMATIIIKQQEAVAAGRSIVQEDFDFHELLARMSKSRSLQRLLFAVVDLLEQTRDLQIEERLKKSCEGHHEIFEAIKHSDCMTARLAMSQHIEEVESIVVGKAARVI